MKYLPFVLTAVFSLTGCIQFTEYSSTVSSRIPEPTGYTYSTQHKMQAAYHWNVLAHDLSNRINNELIRGDFLNKSIFVKETCGNDNTPCNPQETTQFNEGFRDLLITELVGYGIPTATVSSPESIVVNYKVQVIPYRKNRIRTIRPGVITALTSAIMVLRNAPSELLGITAGLGLDLLNSTYAAKTDFEVIITTSMVFQDKYFFRSSDIYYINAEDFHHYQEHYDKAKTIEIARS